MMPPTLHPTDTDTETLTAEAYASLALAAKAELTDFDRLAQVADELDRRGVVYEGDV